MSTYLICLVATLSGTPATAAMPTVYRPSPVFEAAIRGQSPTYEQDPVDPNSITPLPPPTYAPAQPMPGTAPLFAPFQTPMPLMDPFSGQPVAPLPGTAPGGAMYGANGPRPYRFGWSSHAEVGWIEGQSIDSSDYGSVRGDLQMFEVDAELRYTTPFAYSGWIFSASQQFNYRTLEGPTVPELPPGLYRFGWDLKLATPANSPWSFEFGFTPSLNSSFEKGLGADAWNFDGRVVAYFRQSPQWMWVIGAEYWDRVRDLVVPYAGVVVTPNDRWELRLLFPEGQISYFLGNSWGTSYWLYVTGEYHVEAYEVESTPKQFLPVVAARQQDQLELEDWRLMIGLRTEQAGFLAFIEGGWLLGRRARFRHDSPDFEISNGAMIRAGLRY